MSRILRAVFAAALVAVSSGAFAQDVVDATNPETLADIIRDLGYRAVVKVDGVGDPMIESSVGGTDVAILFFGCVEHEHCKSLLFKVGYDLEEGTTLDVINEWNAENLFGRAYLDEVRDPWIEMPVNLFEGVTRKNFEDTFDWWDVVVGNFEDFIDL